jgi:hypothetical protein
MTLEDRVTAVAAFGFTPRQARFLVTVALHSGYCLRRQYEAFAGIQYGKNVREFLDGLVGQRLAERFTGRADRGHVYHLHARALYRAIGQEDNRNRRTASAAQIARKLMVLDYVLSRPGVPWYATENEKADLFVTRCGVPADALPRRTFEGTTSETTQTTRYFVHKLPIYVAGEPPVPHFVYLTTEGSADGLTGFLRDHAPLFRHLPAWTVVAIGPVQWPGLRAAFERYVAHASTVASASLDDLRWYFERRRIVERGELAQIPVQDLRRFRDLRQRLDTPAYSARYAAWLASGEIGPATDGPTGVEPSVGQLVTETLPFSYEQFGSLPGVA